LTRIELPKQCQKIEYKQPDNYHWGILSLSWSPDEKKLVVVCGDEALDGQRDVCVVPIAGNASCWDKSISKNVYRAVWSPSEDVIVIGDRGDDSSKIYLLNPNGTDAVYLTDGWSPEWSPDGKQIAYIRWDVMQTEITPHQIGIATVDSNGKNMRWLYLSEPSSDFTGVIFLNFCDVLSGTCRLTWSPDGRYIAFVASTIEAYAYRLFRLEVKTGEISILLDPAIYGHLMSEPDWGP
jgi:Tol biopolymer transport system component